MKTTYAIKNTENKNLYWSNTYGWVDKDFDLFTLEESKELNLPIDGTWINHIQKDSMKLTVIGMSMSGNVYAFGLYDTPAKAHARIKRMQKKHPSINFFLLEIKR